MQSLQTYSYELTVFFPSPIGSPINGTTENSINRINGTMENFIHFFSPSSFVI